MPLIFSFVLVASSLSSHAQTFSYTGAVQTYTFTHNDCIKLKAWGAGGGIGGSDVAGIGGVGGGGAYAEKVLNVNSGDILQIYTGGGGVSGLESSGGGGGAGGWGYGNGGTGGNAGSNGGSGGGAGGGGSSTVLLNGTIILVAAGGGGGGGSGCGTVGAAGGGGGQAGQVAPQITGSDGADNPSSNANGAQGNTTGSRDGGGGGGGGGGVTGGAGGGVSNQSGSDCNYGGGAQGGGGGSSLGTTVINGAAQVPGNNTDPDLCTTCAKGSTAANVAGGNGLVILIISNITLTTMAMNNGPLCPGATLNLSASAAAITFNWSGPQSFTSSLQNPSITSVTTANSGIYTLIVTDTIGCADTITTHVLVNPDPVAAIIPPVDTLTCAVTSITLSAPSNAAQPAYNWGNGVTSSTFNISQPGTYSVTVTDAATSCSTSASVSVGQNITAPTVSINPPDSLTCAVKTVALTAISDTTGATYRWSNVSSANPDSVSAAGPYTVTATAPGNGCTASASTNVILVPIFTDTFSVTPATCFGTATGSIQVTVNGVAPPYIFTWSNGDSTQQISNIATGNYSVTISDQNQCTAVIGGINVPQPQQIAIAFIDTNETCFGDSNAIINTTVTGGIPGYTYLWNNGATTQNRNNLSTGTYNLTVTDNAGCTMASGALVTQPSPLLVSADYTSPYCATLAPNGSITITPSDGTAPYQYYWNTGSTSSTIANLDTGSYAVTVSDANNCKGDTSFILTYGFNFTVQASPAVTIYLGDSAWLAYSVLGTSGAYTGIWSPDYALGCPDCNITSANPVRTTLYTIEITDSAGCTAKDTVTVNVIPNYPVFIPNVFTPQANGSNDFFEVFGQKQTWQYFSIQIFDRWGEKVYESNDMNFKWDGTFKGKLLQTGVYVYAMSVVFIDDHSDKLFKGDVTLIR